MFYEILSGVGLLPAMEFHWNWGAIPLESQVHNWVMGKRCSIEPCIFLPSLYLVGVTKDLYEINKVC